MMLRDEFGYVDTRTTEAGIEIGLMPMMFTLAICVDVNRDPLEAPYRHRFCYPKEDTQDVIKIYEKWDGLGLPSGNWIKQKGYWVDIRNPRLPKDKYEMDSYEPDYDGECEVCGAIPTVTVMEGGQITHAFGLCGVCTFGTAKAIDPDWWNSPNDD